MSHQWFRKHSKKRAYPLRWSLIKSYRAISSASTDCIWQKVIDLADVSWHPFIARTNVPYGLVPKPGLIYQAINRLVPLPFRIFVERVSPHQLLSFRILGLPGVEERVTYYIESCVTGTYISYSVMMRGWLAPLVWSLFGGYAAKVAECLAEAAETEGLKSISEKLRRNNTCFDF